MKRVLVAIAVLVPLALMAWLAWLTLCDDETPPPQWPVVEEPPPAAAPPMFGPHRVSGKVPPPPVEIPPAPPPEAPPRVARGYLHVVVNAPPAAWLASKSAKIREARDRFGAPGRLTVYWPTGEEIASKPFDFAGRVGFGPLPHGVPLVLRVEKEGCLTGLCCDVMLRADVPLVKTVDLAPTPLCGFEILRLPRREEVRGCRVEIRRGQAVIASGEAEKDGVVWAFVPAIGRLRAVVRDAKGRQLAEVPINAWPSSEPVVTRIYVGEPNALQVVVGNPAGKRVSGATVWLTTDFENPRSQWTDDRGVATFDGLTAGIVYEASTRGSDGSVARAKVVAAGDGDEKVRLILGKPGALVGDVADEGNSVIVGATVEVTMLPFDSPFKAQSDATGAFSVATLPTGLAQVVVRAEGFLDWRPGEPVLVRPAEDVRIRARLRRAPQGAVVVTVRDEDGSPVAGATVDLLPARKSARTAADGTCCIDGLTANSDQYAFAKKRGFRVRTEAQWNPAVATVTTDRAAAVEIVLRASGAEVKRGPASLRGVVLDPSNVPVVGARVECGSSYAFSTTDGSFRLDGLPAATRAEPAEFRILPGPGLVQPLSVFVDLDAADTVDFGAVRLRARPMARILAPRAGGTAAPFAAFWLSSNHAESLLGTSTGRFEPVVCVSYDGTWLHLPPADDWRLDGRGEVFLAQPTEHGLRTATSSWTLTPDAAPTLEPAFVGESQTVVVAVDAGEPDVVLLTQKACATLFDPRSIHVPTGNPQPPVDPFASLAAERSFDIGQRRGATLRDVAPGTWIATFRGSANAVTEFTVPGAGTVIVRR